MRSQLPKLYYEIAYICSWQPKKDRIQYLMSFHTKVGLKKKKKKKTIKWIERTKRVVGPIRGNTI